jgi:hypothetical protein
MNGRISSFDQRLPANRFQARFYRELGWRRLRMKTMKIDADEKELLKSVERGEWKSAGGGKRERTRYARTLKEV